MSLRDSVATTRRRVHRAPLQLFNISLLWLSVNFWWAGVLGLLLPLFVERLVGGEWKGTYLFYIGATGAALSSIIQLVIGPISDRTASPFGRRTPYVFIGVVLSLPAIYLFFHAPLVLRSFGWLLFAYCWVQVWMNVSNGPYQAFIPDLVPEDRQGLASAFMGMMLLIGQAGGFLGYMLLSEKLFVLCWVIIAMLGVSVLYTTISVREPASAASTLPPLEWSRILLVPLRPYPSFVWLMVSRFFINMGFYTALPFLLYYLQDALGSSDPGGDFAKLALLFTGGALLGNWPSGWLADRVSKKAIVYSTCAMMAASAIAFVLDQTLTGAFVIGFAFGLSYGAFVAVDWAFACNLVPKEQEGRYMAVWHLAFTVPQVLAPWVGPVADWFNRTYPDMPGIGWRVAFSIIPIYLAIGAWAVRHVKERKPVSV